MEEARLEAQAANAARNAAEELKTAAECKIQELQSQFHSELDGAQQREPLRVVQQAVRAAVDTPGGLPEGYMRDEDAEVLNFLESHMSRDKRNVISDACHLCTQYLTSRDGLTSSRGGVEHALAVCALADPLAEEMQEQAKRGRDQAHEKHLEAARALLGACDQESGFMEHVVKRRGEVNASASQLEDLLGENTKTIDIDSSSDKCLDIVQKSVSSHDKWVQSKKSEAKKLQGNIREAMSILATTFKSYSAVLLECDNSSRNAGNLNDSRLQTGHLLECIAEQDLWVAGLAREYEAGIRPLLRRAAWVAIGELREESLSLDVLISAAAGAKTVVGDGEKPADRVIAQLSALNNKLKESEKAMKRVQNSVSEETHLLL